MRLDKNGTLMTSLVLTCVAGFSASAQDYPYDGLSTEEQVRQALPTEAPEPKDPARGGTVAPKSRQLSFLGVKAGMNFGVFQSTLETVTSEVTGAGFEGFVFSSWDHPINPIATDFQVGYRSLFVLGSESSLHAIPVQLGTFYRNRLGLRSSWKIGVRAGLELQLDKDDSGQSRWGLMTPLGLAMVWEFHRFVLELNSSVYRIQSGRHFLSSGALLGLRF